LAGRLYADGRAPIWTVESGNSVEARQQDRRYQRGRNEAQRRERALVRHRKDGRCGEPAQLETQLQEGEASAVLTQQAAHEIRLRHRSRRDSPGLSEASVTQELPSIMAVPSSFRFRAASIAATLFVPPPRHASG